MMAIGFLCLIVAACLAVCIGTTHEGPCCPHCGSSNASERFYSNLKGKSAWICMDCANHWTVAL